FAENLRNEETTVEKDSVGDLAGRLQERVQVAGHRGVGNVGQAEFVEEAALLVLGHFAALGDGQEAIHRQLERFLAKDSALQRPADQRGAGARDGDVGAFQVRVV